MSDAVLCGSGNGGIWCGVTVCCVVAVGMKFLGTE